MGDNFFNGYGFSPFAFWLFSYIFFFSFFRIAHSFVADKRTSGRELHSNECKECNWMRNSQGEILAFLFGGYMGATLECKSWRIFGWMEKNMLCATSQCESWLYLVGASEF